MAIARYVPGHDRLLRIARDFATSDVWHPLDDSEQIRPADSAESDTTDGSAVPEGQNRLTKLLLLVAAVAAPSGAAFFFREHPVLAAIGGELLVMVTAFVVRIWDKLEAQYVDSVAEWTSPKIVALITRYRARYRRAICFQHRTLDVSGFNTQVAFPLELDHVFADLDLSPEAPSKVSMDPLRKPDSLGDWQPVWYFLKNEHYRHLAILGTAGSGKTTLLKHIALSCAGPRRNRPLHATPVFLSLHGIQSGISQLTLPDAIRQSLPKRFEAPPGWIENELDHHRFLILLDGLDAIADAQERKRVVQWIESQIKQYDDTRFVVTSRRAGYVSNPIDGVAVLDVKPFRWQQVERFLTNWYLAMETARAGKRDARVRKRANSGSQDLLRRLGANSALGDLAVNPLLLTIIAAVYSESNTLPDRRVELYSKICDVFLGERQASKDFPLDLTPGEKRRVLEPLAWKMMEHNLQVIDRSSAESMVAPVLSLVDPNLQPARFFASVRDSGLIIEQKKGELAFAHLTFQEYLAACHVGRQELELDLAEHIGDEWWRETIRFFAAERDATWLIGAAFGKEPLSASALAVASECLDESAETIVPELLVKLREALLQLVDDVQDDRRRIAAEALLERRIRRLKQSADDLQIDSTLVSNAEYQLFLDDLARAGQSRYPDHWLNTRFEEGTGHFDVAGVRGSDATKFCRWLSAREGGVWVYRLPHAHEVESMPLYALDDPELLRCYWYTEGEILKADNGRFGGADWFERVELISRVSDIAPATVHDRMKLCSLVLDLEITREHAGHLLSVLKWAEGMLRSYAVNLDYKMPFDQDIFRDRSLGRALTTLAIRQKRKSFGQEIVRAKELLADLDVLKERTPQNLLERRNVLDSALSCAKYLQHELNGVLVEEKDEIFAAIRRTALSLNRQVAYFRSALEVDATLARTIAVDLVRVSNISACDLSLLKMRLDNVLPAIEGIRIVRERRDRRADSGP